MKADGLLGRNWLKGSLGDAMHALLCGAGLLAVAVFACQASDPWRKPSLPLRIELFKPD